MIRDSALKKHDSSDFFVIHVWQGAAGNVLLSMLCIDICSNKLM